MNSTDQIIEKAQEELSFSTARSGGSGGQHVNKVETKVILKWNIITSKALSDHERKLLLVKLNSYINKEGEFTIYHQTDRSQLKNKQKVIKKWKALLKLAFKKQKKRKPTSPTKKSKLKNKKSKQRRSELKNLRKKPRL